MYREPEGGDLGELVREMIFNLVTYYDLVLTGDQSQNLLDDLQTFAARCRVTIPYGQAIALFKAWEITNGKV